MLFVEGCCGGEQSLIALDHDVTSAQLCATSDYIAVDLFLDGSLDRL